MLFTVFFLFDTAIYCGYTVEKESLFTWFENVQKTEQEHMIWNEVTTARHQQWMPEGEG